MLLLELVRSPIAYTDSGALDASATLSASAAGDNGNIGWLIATADGTGMDRVQNIDNTSQFPFFDLSVPTTDGYVIGQVEAFGGLTPVLWRIVSDTKR